MNHPRELLPLIAEGMFPPEEVRVHIAGCSNCSQALEALSPLSLTYAWEGIEAEVVAPRVSFLERILEAAGMEPSVARFAALTPSLRPAWLVASVAILAAAVWAMFSDRPPELSVVLVAAPVLAAAVVAFAYGPTVDAAYELVASTPLSPLTALLVRLAAVLLVNSVFVGAADAIAGNGHGVLAWFLPMTGVALFAAVVAVRTQPIVGAASGVAVWCLLVVAAVSISKRPEQFLWGPESLLFHGVLAAVCLIFLMRWANGGLITPFRVRG